MDNSAFLDTVKEGERRFPEYKEPTGYITFGPKTDYQVMVGITYTPTPEQIKNLQDFFGWDYIPK